MCYKVGIGGYGVGIGSWSWFQVGFPNTFLYVGLLRIYVEILDLGESSLVDASWGLKVWRGGQFLEIMSA
jgi:hypothetical protein